MSVEKKAAEKDYCRLVCLSGFMFSKADRNPFIDNWEIKAQHKVHKTNLDLCDNCAEEMANVLYDNFNIGEKE